MKRVNKKSLRHLPWLYLAYALFNDLIWYVILLVLLYSGNGGVNIAGLFIAFVGSLAFPIASILCIYGLVDLSDYFRKSCYVFLFSMILLMANMLLLFCINMPSFGSKDNLIGIMSGARELIMNMRVPMDALSSYLLLKGFSEELDKSKEQKLSRNCFFWGRLVLFLGIVALVMTMCIEIIEVINSNGQQELKVISMALSVITLVVNGLLLVFDIPVFTMLKKAAKKTYEILSCREESC